MTTVSLSVRSPAARVPARSYWSHLGAGISWAIIAALLVTIGVVTTRALDSALLGIMVADLSFLFGVSMRSMVAPYRHA